MPIKAVLFDLDGTLLDTAPDFVAVINQLAKEHQLASPSVTEIRQQVSNGTPALVKLLFGLNKNDTGFDEKRKALLDSYEALMGQHCALFDGMYDLLETLTSNGLLWGIITNKPVRFAEPIVEQLSVPNPAALLLCPDHVKNPKPHPEALLLASQQLGCSPADIVYIGDHKRDIDCGRLAGAKTIAVSFGYLQEDDNIHDWQADEIAHHASEIWPLIASKF